jgi:hypothetical protein
VNDSLVIDRLKRQKTQKEILPQSRRSQKSKKKKHFGLPFFDCEPKVRVAHISVFSLISLLAPFCVFENKEAPPQREGSRCLPDRGSGPDSPLPRFVYRLLCAAGRTLVMGG